MYQRIAPREAPVKVATGSLNGDGTPQLVSLNVQATYANTIEAADRSMKTTLLHVVDMGKPVLVRQVERTSAELDRGHHQDEHEIDPAVPEEIAEDLPGIGASGVAGKPESKPFDPEDAIETKPEPDPMATEDPAPPPAHDPADII